MRSCSSSEGLKRRRGCWRMWLSFHVRVKVLRTHCKKRRHRVLLKGTGRIAGDTERCEDDGFMEQRGCGEERFKYLFTFLAPT